MKTVYLICAVPAAGKSFVASRVGARFEYVHHDLYIGMAGDAYVNAILQASKTAMRPILAEAPFSISAIKDPLEALGFRVVPVFIMADERELHRRWDARGNVAASTRKGHLSRQGTFRTRAKKWRAFCGTSDEVVRHLQEIPL